MTIELAKASIRAIRDCTTRWQSRTDSKRRLSMADSQNSTPERLRNPSTDRVALVEAAGKSWVGQLVDLTARNNLLFFRDLKAGTLDLGTEPPGVLFDVLAGQSVSLSRLVPDTEQREAALKRARVIHNRAREHFEERGLETLFVACGIATWDNQRGAATPAAPVLLCPASLTPRGAAQTEFELAITAEAEVNQTLLHALEADFGCHCDAESLLAHAGIEGAIDTPEELEIAYEWLRQQAIEVPGFDIAPRFVLGTFAYAKLSMVKDLEGSTEAMSRHDLIAALAGDEQARAAIRGRRVAVDPSEPNHVPPSDEFLVLDADHSQNYAINALLGGQDVVIKGPPGTGKSQTIANLISTLVARQKRVLFVAEKRAAIDAVLRRLDDVGLADLVLDLHGGVGSRRQVARALSEALTINAQIARPDLDAHHRLLLARRNTLQGYADAVHAIRSPWNVTLFDAQSRLLALNQAVQTDVRFRASQLDALDAQSAEEIREELRSYVGLGGITLEDSDLPWARGAIVSSEEAAAAHVLMDGLLHDQIQGIHSRLSEAAQSTAVQPAMTFGAWGERLALWRDVAGTLEHFKPSLYELDLHKERGRLIPLTRGAGSRVAASMASGAYRASRKAVKAHLQDGVKLSPVELFQAVEAAGDQQGRWNAIGSDLPVIPADLDGLCNAYAHVCESLGALAANAGHASIDGDVTDVVQVIRSLRNDTATLAKLPELYRLRTSLERRNLGELLADLRAQRAGADRALGTFDYAWLTSIVDHVRLVDSRVGAFDGVQHSRTLAEFQRTDRMHIETTAQRVRRACAEQAVLAEETYEDQGALIRDQAARKRKHMSVRQLFSAAPEMMTSLKPCWAMSPLVVSQLLPGNRPYFDVVVFDEASQIRPAEAMPAILRGKRLAVAGDERQLPPTAFFTGSDPALDSVESEGRLVVDAGYESILEALLPFLDFRMLQWHYRSRDERLIAFSNAHLYDRSLTTFPGITGPDAMLHVLVPFKPGEHGSEDSAGSEVERVVELILDHAETRPGESLGIIAMGVKHADRVEELLRRALADRPDLEEFFDETKPERFFIKNLERVQGDERDAIILTVGYGKSPDGRMLYRFGPLNQEGGERRLNVAITRAKARMTIVSSFTAADMDPDCCHARGVDLLRLYLQYAGSRGATLDRQARETPELNPFEIDVRDTLTRAGIPLVSQLGASRYRIDFAAKHPSEPGRMVLAIETDGASYHSSPTVRDRDRLRQEHLERLGWRFHRIWSQDWFTDKEREAERAVAAYREAVDLSDAPPSIPEGRDKPAAPGPIAPGVVARSARPAVPPGCKIDEYTEAELVSVVEWIESDTLLRTRDQLLSETMEVLGFRKRGKRIVAAINSAIDAVRPSEARHGDRGLESGRSGRVSEAAASSAPSARSSPEATPNRRPTYRNGDAVGRLRLDDATVCVIDTETTGLRRQDRIVEIAVIRMSMSGEVIDEFETLVNPSRTVSDTTPIHGISDRDLLDAPPFADVAGDIVARLDGAIWAGHNIPFDVRFLAGELDRLGWALPTWPAICTMRMARVHGGGRGGLGLSACCDRYGVAIPDGLHRASVDARITGHLLAEMTRRRGCATFAELGICDGEEWAMPLPQLESIPVATGQTRLRGHHEDLTLDGLRAVRGDGASPGGLQRYLDTLGRALEDRRIDENELDALFAVASSEGLNASRAFEAHAMYLAGLARKAYADGVLSESERSDLSRVGLLLEIEPDHAAAIISAEAMGTSSTPTSHDLVGATVCFTGELLATRNGQPISRKDAHGLAAQAGLVPVRSVTRGLDILVVADPYSVSQKAEKARAQGTRILAAEAFWAETGIAVD